AGALLGGLLGGVVGLQVALWIAVTGGVVGALLLLPSPLPRFRLPQRRARWREAAACGQNVRMRTIALEEHFWTAALAEPPGTGVLARPGGRQLDEALRDLGKARLPDMDAPGVDMQGLSPAQPAPQRLARPQRPAA